MSEVVNGELYDLINDLWVLIGEPSDGGGAGGAQNGGGLPPAPANELNQVAENQPSAAIEASNGAIGAVPAINPNETNSMNNELYNAASASDGAQGSQLEIKPPEYDPNNSMPSWSDVNSGDESYPSPIVEIIDKSSSDDSQSSNDSSN